LRVIVVQRVPNLKDDHKNTFALFQKPFGFFKQQRGLAGAEVGEHHQALCGVIVKQLALGKGPEELLGSNGGGDDLNLVVSILQ
jgi:hypothetical protein